MWTVVVFPPTGSPVYAKTQTTVSVKSIHDYVTVQFHAGFVRQSPRRYGNRNICLLSHLQLDHAQMETRVRWDDGELILGAGQVHAVAQNDEFRVQTPWTDQRKPVTSIACKVKAVKAFTSVLETVDPGTKLSLIKTAWVAVPCTHLSNRVIRVELSSRLEHDQWQDKISKSQFLKLSKGAHEFSPLLSGVRIDINDKKEYQILDERMCVIQNLPTVSMDACSAIDQTMKILDHVAKFKYIERLENLIPDLEFEQSIRTELRDSKGHSVKCMGNLNISNGGIVELRCTNLSNIRVYLSVFNLTALWQVENLLIKKYGDFKDLPRTQGASSSDKPLKIKIEIPQRLAHLEECDEVIKVFVTSRPVSLSSLRLPALESGEPVAASTRSTERSIIECLQDLTSKSRGGDNAIRDDFWLSRNFVVHVSRTNDVDKK